MANKNNWRIIKNSNDKQNRENSYTNFLINNFEKYPNYKTCVKNFGETTYKIQIHEVDTHKKSNKMKRMLVYPYDDFVFNTGDYSTWEFGDMSTDWLILASDLTFKYNAYYTIAYCNNSLNWFDSNKNEISYPCFIYDKMTETELALFKEIIIAEGQIIVVVQNNNDTSLIDINNRFVFDSQVYKINSMKDFVDDGLLVFTMRKDGSGYDDDFDNNIANTETYNYTIEIGDSSFTQNIGYTTTLSATVKLDGIVVSKSIIWSSSDDSVVSIDNDGNIELLSEGSSTILVSMEDNEEIYDEITITSTSGSIPSEGEIVVLPNIEYILQGRTVSFSVYKYIDNIQQSDTFSVIVEELVQLQVLDITTEFYRLTIIDGNHFTIENIKKNGTITIRCTDMKDKSFKTFTIDLRGFW